MNLISISGASKEVRDIKLYDNISFGIDDEDKIAIIGVNGSGKSTLLNIIEGSDFFDKGTLVKNKNLKTGVLTQNIIFNPEHTILEHIFSSENERIKIIKEHIDLTEKIKSGTIEYNNEVATKLEKIEFTIAELDAWKIEGEIREILTELQINNTDLLMGNLSGGMVKKVALSRLLIEDSNLLLLDEPTNHLDLASIAWLEEYLTNLKKAILIITHDRYFLDNVANHILEIDNKSINKYKAHYSQYLEKKEEMAIIEQRTLDKHNKILASELEWLNRMPKARGTKQKARKDQFEARVSIVESMEKKDTMGNLFSKDTTGSKRVVEVVNILKDFDGVKYFPGFSYEFVKKERIAVIGDNGSGKTTLLQTIMKEIEPDTGKVTHGVNTKCGYLGQQPVILDDSLTLLQSIKEVANYIEVEDGKKIMGGDLLERFLFKGSQHYQSINKLSGGERRRVDIIRTLMENPNLLILDEPTNDLDLQTLSILEDYLLDFPGCLIVVSHDRYFLDKIADKIFLLEKNKPVSIQYGRCSDYIKKKSKEKPVEPKKEKMVEKGSRDKSQKTKRLSYKDELRKKEIEKLIPLLETEIQNLEKKLSSGESNIQLLETWGTEHIETEKRLFSLLSELGEIESRQG